MPQSISYTIKFHQGIPLFYACLAKSLLTLPGGLCLCSEIIDMSYYAVTVTTKWKVPAGVVIVIGTDGAGAAGSLFRVNKPVVAL